MGNSSKRKRDARANLEKQKILAPEQVKLNNKKKRATIITVIILIIVAVILAVIVSFNVVKAVGKNNLKKAVTISKPVLEQKEEVTEEEQVIWQDGWIKYNGKIYEYNEDVLTFLIMGIDKDGEVKEVSYADNAGQADALFLIVLNPADESLKVIGINRNTIADIDVYSDTGAYVKTMRSQICLQHAYGNGLSESCEWQKEAIQKLMYHIPIHGYAAINRNSIVPITDAVGGLDVTVIESGDYGTGTEYLAGDDIHLDGETALQYVWDREDAFGGADKRLMRQKQYITTFIGKAKEVIKSNPGIALEIYNAVSKQMVTDMTADEVTYLASEFSGYGFDRDSIVTIPGENVMGEKFDEFYVDEDGLYDLIINIFYKEVEQ